MASIGLMDVDLWSREKTYPNLELMKVYNYYYSSNNIITMLKPKDSIDRFSKVFYFKDKPQTRIPKDIIIDKSNTKVECVGYGFYNQLPNLIPEIAKLPPKYLPYSAYTNRLKGTNIYDKMQRDSYIRVATNDFSDFKEDRKNIYVADYDFIHLPNIKNFLEGYKNYTFTFIHPLILTDETDFELLVNYIDNIKSRRPVIKFDYSTNFLSNNCSKQLIISDQILTLEKYIKSILIIKAQAATPMIHFQTIKLKDKITSYITAWYKDSQNESSYCNYYKNNSAALNLMESCDSKIRLLLKTNPKSYKGLDF